MIFKLTNRVLYVVNHCMPYSSNGYAVRTHNIATGLAKNGVDINVIGKPGFYKPTTDASANHSNTLIEGIRYIFPYLRDNLDDVTLENELIRIYEDLINVFKPNTVMCASNWELASPVLSACQQTKTPFVYDVRGFWELSRAAMNPKYAAEGLLDRDIREEKRIARSADALITINQFMKNALIKRGVEAQRIKIVPNSMAPLNDEQTSTRRLGNVPTIGYIGSFNSYEGLDLLINTIYHLKKKGKIFNLVMVGSAEPNGLLKGGDSAKDTLISLAKQLGVEEQCTINGRVAKNEVKQYFELIDLIVIPRKKLEVTSLVSPLKPIEAAAYKKPMLLADLAPLQEYFEAEVAIKMCSYDPQQVAEQIASLFEHKNELKAIAEKANRWYWQSRLPEQVVKSVVPLLIKSKTKIIEN